MIVLYIDTSSSYLYTAIVKDGVLLASHAEEYGQDLSMVALPKMVEMFKKTNLSPKMVDKIIVVNGPGSFTGIRIGVTIAKVYSWSASIPITTITSLEAMAISSETDKIHVPILNARRGYVYTAIFDKNYNCIFKPQHIKIDALKEELKKYDDYEFISNDEFDEEYNLNSYVPNFIKIIEYFKDKQCINPHSINPDYLKLTEAEESKL